MATLVQQNANSTNDGSPDTLAFSSNVTSGNLLIVTVQFRDYYTGTVTGVTGSTNGAYTLAASTSGCAIYYKENCTGGSETVSVAFSASSNQTTFIQASEWSGIATSSSLDDASGQANASSTSVDAPSISNSGAGVAILSGLSNGNTTKTGPTGYTWLAYTPSDPSRPFAAYKVISSAGTENPDYTIDSALETGVCIAVFLDAGGGGATPTITDAGDETYAAGETGITITGTSFLSSQGTGTVKISPTDNVADANAVTQTVTSWGDLSIQFTCVRGTLPANTTLYLFVTNNNSVSNGTGYQVQIKSPLQLMGGMSSGMSGGMMDLT